MEFNVKISLKSIIKINPLGGPSEKKSRPCGDLRPIQAQKGKRRTVCSAKDVRALKCSSAKVHIFLGWQGVEEMGTSPVCQSMPTEP